MTTVTVTERSLRVWHNTVEAKVKVAGSGPPLVFLHGAGGLTWDPFLDGLADRFTVYAPEHPGTSAGNPEAVNPLDDLWDLVLFYYEVFDQLGLRSPVVVGHSFGGMVAAELAATCPERVSQLVLISPIGLWRDDAPVENWMIITPATDLPKYLVADPQGPVAAQVFAMPEDPEVRVSVQLQMIWSMACTGKFVWPIPDKGLKKRIHRITAPTLIIWGKQDRLVPAVYAQEFADRLPGSRIELVDAAGHLVQLEQREQVARVISDFLQASSPT